MQNSPVVTAAGSVWALLFGMGMLLLGNGLQGSLLGVRAASEQFGSSVTGLVMSGYFAGFLIGSQLAPRTIDRVGHLRVFAAIASLASIAILVQGMIVMPVVWGLMRVVSGYCLATAFIVSESWLNDRVTNQNRGGLMAVYMIISYLGMGGGQLLLNVSTPDDNSLFVLVSVLISLAAIPILLSITPQPLSEGRESLGLRQLFRITPLGVVGSFAAGTLQGAVLGMGAVYADRAGLSLSNVSIFMFVLIAGAAGLQWPVGKLSDRIDRRRVITALALFGTLISLVAVPATQGGATMLMTLALFLGAGPMMLYSLFVAYTNDYLRAEQMVAASSALILAFGLGAIIGPIASGGLMDILGPSGFPVVLAATQLAIVAFAFYRMTRRDRGPVSDQSNYAVNPAQSASLSQALAERAVDADDTGGGVDHPADYYPVSEGPSSIRRGAGGIPSGPPPDDTGSTTLDDRM